MFNIKIIKPCQSDWEESDATEVAEAIGDIIANNTNKCLSTKVGNETGFYAVVEVEGSGQFIGRYFYAGIGRKGGVSRKMPNERTSLEEIEKELGIELGSLSEDGWEGEESVEQAWDRKFSRNNI